MIGREIKRYREEKGISQEALAELVGVSRQAVSKWEQGQALPTADNLERLEKALELEEGRLGQMPLRVEDLPGTQEQSSGKGKLWKRAAVAVGLIAAFGLGWSMAGGRGAAIPAQ